MATPLEQLDQIVTTTLAQHRGRLTDQISKRLPLLAALESKSKVSFEGGKEIVREVEFGDNDTVGSFSGYDILDITPQGGFGNAVYNMRQLSGAITISGLEELLNSGPQAIISLVKAKMTQLEKSYAKKLNAMFWATAVGNGGKDLLSIPVIVAATGTLGGIDPVTETWWKSHVTPTADMTTMAGVTTLNNVYNTLVNGPGKADLEFTGQAQFEAYEDLAADRIRFTDTKMAELGFESIAHKGADIVFDSLIPAAKWYFLNSEEIEFVRHSKSWMKKRPPVYPANQDASVSLVLSMGQLLTAHRRAHGVITTVTV